ncbi:hypothetical protein [Photobacterium leiognathi]|uniref:hypothetical protein n=1 Tax=Photobacterium leiognathi TaxID=553611 RepID=UPI002982B20A|nr:hypothetical protein [Photobacterium leiognathi]
MLDEKVKRLEPTDKTKRTLFLLSGNECAFPGCKQRMINERGHYIGEICHIEAAKETGERFNAHQSNEERRDISNLVLMCSTHHKVTDEVDVYDVAKMRDIKKRHESKRLNVNEDYIGIFLDSAYTGEIEYPQNLNVLDLESYDLTSDEIIDDVEDLINDLAQLPRDTRSIYFYALTISECVDEYIQFDPRELAVKLRVRDEEIIKQTKIIQRYGLMSEVDTDEYPHEVWQGFLSKDSDNNQIWFLQLLIKYCRRNNDLLRDIIENLNFIHLEK